MAETADGPEICIGWMVTVTQESVRQYREDAAARGAVECIDFILDVDGGRRVFSYEELVELVKRRE